MVFHSRRTFLASASALLVAQSLPARVITTQTYPQDGGQDEVHPGFPAQDPRLVKEMVGASHGNVARVRELVGEYPELAKAAYDWGFGDWETALGAASHVGNREIAGILIANGARPDLFTFAMLGHMEAVQAMITAYPGIQRTHGPHGLTLLHHAEKGGSDASRVADYLRDLGDADIGYTSVSLTEDEKKIYAGEYRAGSGPLGFEVAMDKNGVPGIKRLPDGVRRVLYYQGNHEFHPAGAPSVRIRFEMEGGRAGGLMIDNGKSALMLQRSGA
jgi:hypothetical protein